MSVLVDPDLLRAAVAILEKVDDRRLNTALITALKEAAEGRQPHWSQMALFAKAGETC